MAHVNVPHLDVHQGVQETLTSLGPGIVYSRLLRLRTGPGDELAQPNLLLQCELCESWEVVDFLTYRFKLREGIRWQNIPPVNGRELTAQDVVFSYERQRTPGLPNAALLQNLREVEAEDRYTLKITLNLDFPDADFLVSLADGHTKVVAEEAVAVNGDLRAGPVIGSGPWVWDPDPSQRDIGSLFTRNDEYFEEVLPFFDELVIRVIPDEETRLTAFVAGRVDVYRISPQAWDQLGQTGKEFNSFLSRQAGTGLILTMNVSAPPFDKLEVRKAVLKALDPWDYVDKFWAGQGFVSLGMPVRTPDWLLGRDEMRGDYFASPSEARELLLDSGLPTPLKFDMSVADFGDGHLRQGTRVWEDLKSVGFDPVFQKLHRDQYPVRVWQERSYQLAVGELPPTSTTNSFLFAILHSRGSWNVLAHSDDRLDVMIEQQGAERDPITRRDMALDIQRYLLEQAYVFSPVTGGARWVFSPALKGFYPNTSASEYVYWAKAWLE